MVNGDVSAQQHQSNARNGIDVLCGPLLNYQHMDENEGNVVWHGSVLIVTKPEGATPMLDLQHVGATKERANSPASPSTSLH